MRLDSYLFKNGLAKSRTSAADMIKNGLVLLNGKEVTKPSVVVDGESSIAVIKHINLVSRGGFKLQAALDKFRIDVSGLICADIGASTGGFTECLLRRGAVRVYAVDSGHGQLDKSLADDDRVTNLEGVNARYLDGKTIPVPCGCVVSDLSFISQTLVIPSVSTLLAKDGFYISLIKPQFECGRTAVGKGGIVKDKKQHKAAILRVLDCAAANGIMPVDIMKSPITGGDGNIEFLFMGINGGVRCVDEARITEAVDE